jgi:glycosyltransferase involved in cell wall biosynthesis
VKIAIYSGEIPTTTFIENLIQGLAQKNQLLLFGTMKRKVAYSKKSIKVFPFYQNPFFALLFSVYWAVRLFLKSYQSFNVLKNHILSLDIPVSYKLKFWNRYGSIVFSEPDIFHVQWTKDASEWLFLKELFGIHLVVSFRGAHMTYSYLADQRIEEEYARVLPKYDGYHAVSQDILNNATSFGVDVNKAQIIPPAVNDIFLTCRPELKTRSGKLELLSIGRNHWVKAYDMAIDACAILAAAKIEFTYTIVGAEESEELEYQIEQLGLGENVVLIGRLPQKKVWDLYRQADFLLLPSHSEGIANVVMEAMTVGLPVISTRCGGVPSVIVHEENGWLVPVRDPKALAQQIIDCMNITQEKRASLIGAAFETVIKNHLLSNQVRQMEFLYEQVLSKNRSVK